MGYLFMQNLAGHSQREGILSAAGAYLIWGTLPVYWKLLNALSAWQILAHRVIWSFLFMLLLLFAGGRLMQFWQEVRSIGSDWRKLSGIMVSSFLISMNWFIYIWAVNANRILETSLGYYINPLLSVLMGIAVLKEKLSFWQGISFLLATAGVLNLTLAFGSVPWASLLLAVSFALYGLAKKMSGISPSAGITLETFCAAPAALLYLLCFNPAGVILAGTTADRFVLVGTGVVTAVPLLLFAHGANQLPLKLLGFLQYLSPTISLLLGVFLYHESFTLTHFISFSCIWLALAIFSLAGTKWFAGLEERIGGKSKRLDPAEDSNS